ncbi:TPA: sensor histidine kinase [Pseudomonas aeruginosa]
MIKKIFAKRPLWLWVGIRMSLLAIGAICLITYGMYLYYLFGEQRVMESMSVSDRAEYLYLIKSPEENNDSLWALLKKYYPIQNIAPGLDDNDDWWALFSLVMATIPLVLALGFVLSRPLSRQFSQFAVVARKIAKGDLSARIENRLEQPAEIQQFATDFNNMGEKLQQYEREVRESSAVLAHELRTPLNAALGRIQGMLDEVFPIGEQQLRLVEAQLLNLNSLVSDLHFLSLAQSGTLRLDIREFDLNRLVEERITWFLPQLEKASIAVSFTPVSKTLIEADSNRIGQMINILIENSIKYAAEGGELAVRLYRSGPIVHLEFNDRGLGVDETELKSMFGRFWRAEQSRARVSGGSGLGLSIAEAIAYAHSGEISATRRAEGGLSVRVSLPIRPLDRL